MNERPVVKVSKPRIPSGGTQGEVIIEIEGRGGQRARIYVSPSDDIMRLLITHDEAVELEAQEVAS